MTINDRDFYASHGFDFDIEKKKIEDIYSHQTGQALENFSLEELELLEKCLSKYCYEVSGLPTVVLSVYNKLQILKEEAENVQ